MNPKQGSHNRPVRVLIVEDSEDILLIMKIELEWMGYAIDVALDATRGLELARLDPPDVIISDIQMPGIDGFELVRQIRSIPELAAIPVIALTGFGLEKDIRQALEQGFTAHLTKPVEPEDLCALIQKLTGEVSR